ncbi:hypothetical protein A3731_26670 [Roseovarius sp. HI0049]|nr:hypothetical protein A3731_26670 [Roseovarius sp. HI0049]
MNIAFSPVRRHGQYAAVKSGDTLIIDGEAFDFSALPNGATLPKEAIACEWIAGPVERDEAGLLTVPLLLPHGANAPEVTRFPDPIKLTADGPVALPAHGTEPEIDT